MQTENTSDIAAALAKAQGAMVAAKFDKTNPHFKNKYASLAAVIDAIRKPLAENGLSYTQATEIRDGGFVLVTTLRNASGQWIASEYPLPMGAKPQELGSALTYARRYSLSAIACIAADEDDDAEGARQSGQTSSAPAPRTYNTKPSDILPAVEYDAAGNPVNNIPRGDGSIARMSKAMARPEFAALQHELRATKTQSELLKWALENANRAETLPADWHEILRGLYTEHQQNLSKTANGNGAA
jgi:hypothetical protein